MISLRQPYDSSSNGNPLQYSCHVPGKLQCMATLVTHSLPSRSSSIQSYARAHVCVCVCVRSRACLGQAQK